ncbi:MAG: CinA family nicotinamide mononucleotide deamidase-related protein [Acidobacteriota bacterium]
MMRAELIMVGTEMLALGARDTNSEFLKRELAAMGYEVAQVSVVVDDGSLIRDAVKAAHARSHLTLVSGGLGPTRDDCTRAAIAAALGAKLQHDDRAWASIRRWYQVRRRRPGPGARKQSQIPGGAESIDNPVGSAPGIWSSARGRTLVALPGVPAELEHLWRASVRSRLEKRQGPALLASFQIGGLSEAEVDRRLSGLYRHRGLDVTLLAKTGHIEVHLRARAPARQPERTLQRAVAVVRRRLGRCIFSEHQESLEQVVGNCLRQRGETLSVAESCTGGGLGARLSGVPGSSDYFRGGVIAYADSAKRALLRVPQEVLRRHGAVSAPTARALAEGARRCLRCDWGLAITGVAGPGGGTRLKPVGTVFLALARAGRHAVARRLRLSGGRETVRRLAVAAALLWLYSRIRGRRPA